MLLRRPLSPAEAAERLADAVRGLSVEPIAPRPGRVHVADVPLRRILRTPPHLPRRPRRGAPPRRRPRRPRPARRGAPRDQSGPRAGRARAVPRPSARRDAGAAACVARAWPATLTASYSSWKLRSLDQQSEQFPSPFFLELYRDRPERPTRTTRSSLAALPRRRRFRAGRRRRARRHGVVALAPDPRRRHRRAGAAADSVAALYPHLADGHARGGGARLGRVHRSTTAGFATGTPELDPRGSAASPSPPRGWRRSRPCPFRYFVRHVLGVEPPEDRPSEIAPAGSTRSWRARCCTRSSACSSSGSRRRREARGRAPCRSDRGDRGGARSARGARRSLRAASSSFGSGAEDLLFACRAFLRLEEEHCRDPVAALLRGALRPARAPTTRAADRQPRARVDRGGCRRVAFCCAARSTASTRRRTARSTSGTTRPAPRSASSEARGLDGGRRIQYALYALALEVLLGRAGLAPARSRVRAISFRAAGARGSACACRSISRRRATSCAG